MQPNVYNMVDPAEAVARGLSIGGGINAVQADAAKQQQIQAAMQSKARQQEELRALAFNPNATHTDYVRMMTAYPELSESLSKTVKTMDEGQQKSALEFGSRMYGALLSGHNDLAIDMFKERAKADPAQAQNWTMMADLIQDSPATARMLGALRLSSLMGPEKFAETFSKLSTEQRATDKAPAELKKAEADAIKAQGDASKAGSDAIVAAEQAKVAPQTVMLDLQKKGWDIKKIQEDIEISKQANRIAAMNAATSRAGNDLKRQELTLKVAEAQEKLNSTVREKVATAEAGATNIDNMLNTVERIKGNKSLNDVLGAIEGRLPALVDDEQADAVALIETLGSQAFLAQIPNIKGMGALSNAEGEKLQAALQNLSRTQSEKQFRANLDEASRLLKKGRETLSKSTGVPLGKPDTPAAPGTRPPLSSFQGK